MIIRPLFLYFRMLTIVAILQLLHGCSEEDATKKISYQGASDSWLIDSTKIVGQLNNSFPVLTNANYTAIKNVTSLSPNSLVLVLRTNKQTYVYPTERMWVEVVNEKNNHDLFAITWCPITESGVAWNRKFGSDTLVFAASGMLYKENLVPYDTTYLSFWSQMLNQGIKGRFSLSPLKNYQVIETTFLTAKEMDPDALLFDVHTAAECNFPGEFISAKNNYLPQNLKTTTRNEDRFYSILESTVSRDIDNGSKVLLVDTSLFRKPNNMIETSKYLIIYDKQKQLITTFNKGSSSKYEYTPESFPLILSDEFQNIYNIFGQIVEGPNKGDRLRSPASYSAKKWALDKFYNQLDYVEDN